MVSIWVCTCLQVFLEITVYLSQYILISDINIINSGLSEFLNYCRMSLVYTVFKKKEKLRMLRLRDREGHVTSPK